MTDITLGQSITGSFSIPDPKSYGYFYDIYDFVGLDDYRQFSINVNATNTIGPLLIDLIDPITGAVINVNEAIYGGGTISLNKTTFPGVKYQIIVGGQSGEYTLSTVNGGKATSIVSTSQVQTQLNYLGQGIAAVGTVGANGKFFPLATSTSGFTLADLALSADGQFYGVSNGTSSNFLYRIDPKTDRGNQISLVGGSQISSFIYDLQGNILSGKIKALEFSADNKLYAIDTTTTGDKLYTINPVSQVATLVGNLPASFTNSGDIVYDAANNRFFATAQDSATSDALWQIPINNPAGATKIGQIGFTNVTGLDFEGNQLTGFNVNTDGTGIKIGINTATGSGTLVQNIAGVYSISGASTIFPAPTTPRRNDFGGDRKADILWRNTSGEAYIYQMNGSTVANEGSLGIVNNNWQIAGTGDFNGDGKSDILWRNTVTGETYAWRMNGNTKASEGTIRTVGNDWQIAGTGDFNGDGKSDILWRNTNSGLTYGYLMNDLTVASEGAIRTVGSDWQIAGTGDFNGDGKSDILWRNTNSGLAYIYLMNGTSVLGEGAVRQVSNDWIIEGVDDFNNDGKSDILWRNANTGSTYIYLMNGSTVSNESEVGIAPINEGWNIAGTGDYNGDAKADILWRNNNGLTYLWTMDGLNQLAQGAIRQVDNSWQIAAPTI
jgi:FG-GAP-like repeat/FG-GAP repeat